MSFVVGIELFIAVVEIALVFPRFTKKGHKLHLVVAFGDSHHTANVESQFDAGPTGIANENFWGIKFGKETHHVVISNGRLLDVTGGVRSNIVSTNTIDDQVANVVSKLDRASLASHGIGTCDELFGGRIIKHCGCSDYGCSYRSGGGWSGGRGGLIPSSRSGDIENVCPEAESGSLNQVPFVCLARTRKPVLGSLELGGGQGNLRRGGVRRKEKAKCGFQVLALHGHEFVDVILDLFHVHVAIFLVLQNGRILFNVLFCGPLDKRQRVSVFKSPGILLLLVPFVCCEKIQTNAASPERRKQNIEFFPIVDNFKTIAGMDYLGEANDLEIQKIQCVHNLFGCFDNRAFLHDFLFVFAKLIVQCVIEWGGSGHHQMTFYALSLPSTHVTCHNQTMPTNNDDDNSKPQEHSELDAKHHIPKTTVEDADQTDEAGSVTIGPGTSRQERGAMNVEPGTRSKDRDGGYEKLQFVYRLIIALNAVLIVAGFVGMSIITDPSSANARMAHEVYTNALTSVDKAGKILVVFNTLMVDMASILVALGRCSLMILWTPFLLILSPTLNELHWKTSVTLAELVDVSSEGWTIPPGATLVNIEMVPRTDTPECTQQDLTMPYYHFTVKEWRKLPPLVLHGTDQTPVVEYASYNKSEVIRVERSTEEFWGVFSDGRTFIISDETLFKDMCTSVGQFLTYRNPYNALEGVQDFRCIQPG